MIFILSIIATCMVMQVLGLDCVSIELRKIREELEKQGRK